MEINNVKQIIKPEPDSQFRLKNCKCGSNMAVYLQMPDKLWIVLCSVCKRKTNRAHTRHGAQLEWNGISVGKEQRYGKVSVSL